jgi:hypothetical protein
LALGGLVGGQYITFCFAGLAMIQNGVGIILNIIPTGCILGFSVDFVSFLSSSFLSLSLLLCPAYGRKFHAQILKYNRTQLTQLLTRYPIGKFVTFLSQLDLLLNVEKALRLSCNGISTGLILKRR